MKMHRMRELALIYLRALLRIDSVEHAANRLFFHFYTWSMTGHPKAYFTCRGTRYTYITFNCSGWLLSPALFLSELSKYLRAFGGRDFAIAYRIKPRQEGRRVYCRLVAVPSNIAVEGLIEDQEAA